MVVISPRYFGKNESRILRFFPVPACDAVPDSCLTECNAVPDSCLRDCALAPVLRVKNCSSKLLIDELRFCPDGILAEDVADGACACEGARGRTGGMVTLL